MPILDAQGRPLKPTKKDLLTEVGSVPVRDRYSSYPSQGLTPEKLARILKEADSGHVASQAMLFQEMEEKDAHLYSVLASRKLAVTGLEMEILPASDSAEDKRIAEAAREMFDYEESLGDDLRDVLDAIGKGFSVNEIIWDLSEGQYWIKRLSWIHQKHFTFSPRDTRLPMHTEPYIITEANPIHGEELRPYKYVYFRSRARSGSPSRGGLIRPCAYMYLFKNYDVKDWVVFAERFAMPIRVGKYKPETSEADKDVLKDAVFNLASDAAAVISDSTLIEFIEQQAKGASVDVFERLAAFCDAAMSKAVLGHSASSESTPGKLGSEHEASDLRQDLLESDARALANIIKNQMLAPWVAVNFGPDKAVPKVKFAYEPPEDRKSEAETYGTLVSQVGLPIPLQHIYDKFGIPAPDGEEQTTSGARSGDALPMALKGCPSCGGGHKQLALKDGPADAVDGIVESTLSEDVSGDMVESIRKIVMTSVSLEDAREKLYEAYKALDAASLGEVMARGMMLADLVGREEAEG